MDILLALRRQHLEQKLKRLAGGIKFLPRLLSVDPSLDAKPARSALEMKLCKGECVILEGVAGSGKSVVALSLALESKKISCAYLEASEWAPAVSAANRLEEFILRSSCDDSRAFQALEQGGLVLLLDAIDEAPWTTSGTTAIDALIQLSSEIHGKAGLLVTSRTSRQVPQLDMPPIDASLGGIDPDEVEKFLAFYSGGRSGVGKMAEDLKSLDLPLQLKYSPLVLRLFADGLSSAKIPSEPVALFESMVDFLLDRECKKSISGGRKPRPRSWQERYSQQDLHRALVSTLVFYSGKSGRTVSESELQRLADSHLHPDTFDARDLVNLSTLMSQHPLVAVSYLGSEHKNAEYNVECPHDWVRTGLFPSFLSEKMLAAQLEVLDSWHQSIPHWEDYASAWNWLAEVDRADENLKSLSDLSVTRHQETTIARWLATQFFYGRLAPQVANKLFKAFTLLASRFASADSDLSQLLDLQELATGPLILSKLELHLDDRRQVVNFSGLAIQDSSLIVETEGPARISLRDCSIFDTSLRAMNDCQVQLVGCVLTRLSVELSSSARLVLQDCLYDPNTCPFPAATVGLDLCEATGVEDQLVQAWVLREVLRRLIIVGEKPELSKKKSSIAEDNMYKGPLGFHKALAERTLRRMQSTGYVVLYPTGSRTRVDLTKKFSAHEAAVYVKKPTLGGVGPMTKEILAAGATRDKKVVRADV